VKEEARCIYAEDCGVANLLQYAACSPDFSWTLSACFIRPKLCSGLWILGSEIKDLGNLGW